MGWVVHLFLRIVFLVFCFFLFAQGNDGNQEKEFEEQVKDLISKLGAEEWGVREEATRKLIELGDKAGKYVEEATKSGDAEVRMRAERIIEEIGYVSGDLKERLIALCEKLKSQDSKVRDDVFKEIQSIGRPAGRFLRRYFKGFKAVELKAEILFEEKVVYIGKRYNATVVVKNESEEGCWLDIRRVERVHLSAMVRVEGGAIGTGGGWSGRRVLFPYEYFPPKSEKRFEGYFSAPACGDLSLSLDFEPSAELELEYASKEKEIVTVPVFNPLKAAMSGIVVITPPEGAQREGYVLQAEIPPVVGSKEKFTLKATLMGFVSEESFKKFEVGKERVKWYVLILRGSEVKERKSLSGVRCDEQNKVVIFESEMEAPEEEGEYKVVVYTSFEPGSLGGSEVGAPYLTLKVKKREEK
ncbi:MAG: hypothetical protein N2234_09355 [Planctomycetota bacterium]|nr:hypothetical protein [Planctomycetota bacterium]